MNTSEILTRAADLIEERGWNQGWYVNNCGGLCAIGAMYVAAGVEIPAGLDFPDISDDTSNAVLRAYRIFSDHVGRYAPSWNDTAGRTKEEVVTALRGAAEAARAELTAVVVGGSACALLQIAVVLALWRFKSIRPTLDAVLQERIAEPGFGESVWAGLDRALAEPWDDDEAHWGDCGCPDCRTNTLAVEDDIDALVDAINEDREKAMFALWEAEFGERAS